MKDNSEILKTPDSCCGCGACANVCPVDAITMKPDDFGFLYPEVDHQLCIQCQKCEKVCDFIKPKQRDIMPVKSYAAVHKDASVLGKSSSGGVFYALAEYVLSCNGAVCGCVYDDALKVMHICVEEKNALVSMQKSKYVQSNVGFVYRQVKERLDKGQMILFTCTPCQVAALNSYLAPKRYENLLTMDLVCHGVPSQEMFRKYLNYLEQKYKVKITAFDFRSKRYGWQRWSTEFTDDKNKRKNIGKINEFYIPAFTGGNIMRPSCFSCKYACKEREGDITVGDFWGQEKSRLALDVKHGVSLCVLNSEKAAALVPVLEKWLQLEEIDYNIAVSKNHCLHDPTPKGSKWEAYMDAFRKDQIPLMAAKYIKSHKKQIFRSKLRNLVPIGLFQFVRKLKYR